MIPDVTCALCDRASLHARAPTVMTPRHVCGRYRRVMVVPRCTIVTIFSARIMVSDNTPLSVGERLFRQMAALKPTGDAP